MKRIIVSAVFLALVLAILFSGGLKDLLGLNLAALDAAHWALNGRPFLAQQAEDLKFCRDCRVRWMESFGAAAQGDLAGRDQAYRQAVACDAGYVEFLQQMYPDEITMAQLALQAQPGSAESWFWAGDLEPGRQLEYYHQGLALDPSDGRRWVTYGELLSIADPQAAIQAYLQACLNGDPGYHGCGKAGALAEKMGDTQAAIQYYRLSSYSPIRKKADDLEKSLSND